MVHFILLSLNAMQFVVECMLKAYCIQHTVFLNIGTGVSAAWLLTVEAFVCTNDTCWHGCVDSCLQSQKNCLAFK